MPRWFEHIFHRSIDQARLGELDLPPPFVRGGLLMGEAVHADQVNDLVELEHVKATFRRKYLTIAALRLLSIDGSERAREASLDEVGDDVSAFLKTEVGRRELERWVTTFTPAFREIDDSYAEISQPPEQLRSISDWLSGVRAEDLAVGALVARCRQLMTRSDRSKSSRSGRSAA